MLHELEQRNARITWKTVAALIAASATTYALVAYNGVAGVALIAGLAGGYLVARTTKI